MTTQVNVYEAKTQLSKLLELVASGERVVIAKAGKPVADLVPHQGGGVRFGGLKGVIKYDDETWAEDDAAVCALFKDSLSSD